MRPRTQRRSRCEGIRREGRRNRSALQLPASLGSCTLAGTSVVPPDARPGVAATRDGLRVASREFFDGDRFSLLGQSPPLRVAGALTRQAAGRQEHQHPGRGGVARGPARRQVLPPGDEDLARRKHQRERTVERTAARSPGQQRLLLAEDLRADRAGHVVFNDRHHLQAPGGRPIGRCPPRCAASDPSTRWKPRVEPAVCQRPRLFMPFGRGAPFLMNRFYRRLVVRREIST